MSISPFRTRIIFLKLMKKQIDRLTHWSTYTEKIITSTSAYVIFDVANRKERYKKSNAEISFLCNGKTEQIVDHELCN